MEQRAGSQPKMNGTTQSQTQPPSSTTHHRPRTGTAPAQQSITGATTSATAATTTARTTSTTSTIPNHNVSTATRREPQKSSSRRSTSRRSPSHLRSHTRSSAKHVSQTDPRTGSPRGKPTGRPTHSVKPPGGAPPPRSRQSSKRQPKVPEVPLVIASKYKVGEELGSGSFGAIYFASHIHSGQPVAVKLETAKAHKQRRSQLEIEYRLYRILQGHAGIPRIYWFGRESGCRALVMELLGPSLEDMFKQCKRIFSVKTVRYTGYHLWTS